ncbi:hypothetical protein, partial [Hypericibacter sp.]|uniref:hypothetical protein n=1 Tax=Hypericibacter sp. TaxID=2705401 RepID=UPI003D6CDAF3
TSTPILYVATPNGIFATSNGGGSWVHTTTDSQGRAFEPILSLAVDPQDSNHLIAGAGAASRIYVSTDGGQTWRRKTVDSTQGATQVYAVAIDSQFSNEILAATDDGSWRSGDSGDSFEAYRGLFGCLITHAAAIDSQHSLIRYAGTDCGLFKTTEGEGAAAVWTHVEQLIFDQSSSGSHLEDVIGTDLTAIALDPAHADTLYVGTRSGAAFKVQIYQNGGQFISPMTFNNGFVAAPIGAIALDPQQPGVIYAATAGQGIFKGSTTGWGRWLPFSTGLGNLQVTSLATDAGNSRKLYVGTENGVYAIEQSSVLPPGPDLALHVTVTQGKAVSSTTGLRTLIFRITLNNNGPGAAASAKVTTAFLAPGLKPLARGSVSVAKLISSSGRCDSRIISCAVGPLAVGASATITLSVDPAHAMHGKVLTAKITASGTAANDIWGVPDAHPADNEIQTQVPIRIPQKPSFP